MDDELLTLLTPKLLGDAPNTYAYTKCLTEQLVRDCAKKIPIAIARPSIGKCVMLNVTKRRRRGVPLIIFYFLF